MPPLPAKKDVLLALLERSSVYIHLDPRRDDVRVPPWFKKQPQLILQIGLNMAVPIRDLSIDDDAVSGTLSFSRSPHFCYMPWPSVYALIGEDSRGMVWPEDIPPEVMAQKAVQAQKSKRPKLKAVADPDENPAGESKETSEPRPDQPAPGPSTESASAADRSTPPTPARGEKAPPAPTASKSRPPYLRVVK